MGSKLLENLEKEFSKGYYKAGTLLNFFKKAPLKELEEGYQFILNSYIQKDPTKERVCKTFVCSMLLFWFDREDGIRERVMLKIPDLKLAYEKKGEKESSLEKTISTT